MTTVTVAAGPATVDAVYFEPTEESGRRLIRRGITGPVSMLNLLRFREIADYTHSPHLAPDHPISGREAYDRYAAHTMPHLTAVGGAVEFLGEGGHWLIGPPEERWDTVMMVRYPTVEAFLGMASNEAYLAGLGHRTAALEDSRLLPVVGDG